MRLSCVAYAGADYLLVLDGARVVRPPQVARLARASMRPRRDGGARRFECVMVDESVPAARGGNRPFRLAGFRWPSDLPVELDCGGITHQIGVLESITRCRPGATAGAQGWHLRARARLLETALADLAWAELRADRLTGICVRAQVDATEDARHTAGTFTALRLDYPSRVCLAGARVLGAWQEAG